MTLSYISAQPALRMLVFGEMQYYFDSPLLMLLIMVVVAAIIVPLHHKIEKTMVTRLQLKNNKIRLEAAKKTIAELSEPLSEANS